MSYCKYFVFKKGVSGICRIILEVLIQKETVNIYIIRQISLINVRMATI